MTDSNNLLRHIYILPKPSDYICSPYADYNPVAKTITKKKAAPDTVVVGGVTYHREKVKKTKVSTTTVISLRLENETVETVDAIRKWLCVQDDETELTRAGAIKDAVSDLIKKYISSHLKNYIQPLVCEAMIIQQLEEKQAEELHLLIF